MFYHIITYGCQMNESDSERIASVLEDAGYSPTPGKSEADLIVINVCSVRQRAIDRVFGKINKIKDKRLKVKVILTGCILEKDKKKFQGKVDLIFDIKDLSQLPKLLQNKSSAPMHRCIGAKQNYLEIQPPYQSKSSAYVPVMNGCDNFCSYCVVPYVRGREYSRATGKILDEVKGLVKKGYKEITLLGQNVNSYKSETGIANFSSRSDCGLKSATPQNSKLEIVDFPKLLKLIDGISGNFWLRFVTSHPKDMSDELIEMVARCDKVCEYIHLPVQSGDDKILEKMNRKYTVKHYLNLIEKIRNKIPNVAITTDAIVGFPGETKKQFQNTVKVFKKVGFDMAYIAQYSERAGTAAAKLKDNVPHEKKKQREKVLTEVLKKTALENNKKYVGKTVKILVESNQRGKTRTFKNVQFESGKDLVGNFVKVKIIGATPWGLKGELIKGR